MGASNRKKESATLMPRTRKLAVATVVAIVCALLGGASAQAALTHDFSFAAPGSGAGQLKDPSGIAVNTTTGDVYIADSGNRRVVQFDKDGNFIRTWGEEVNATTGGDVCTAASGNTCKEGVAGTAGGQFSTELGGIGVDNSGGPASGSVYIQDMLNNRVQRFDNDGDFVLTWGKAVNLDTGGDVCPATDACKTGEKSGKPESNNPPTPPVPSDPGHFAGWNTFAQGSDHSALAVDADGFVLVGDPLAIPGPRVQKFDSGGNFVSMLAPKGAGDIRMWTVRDLATDAESNVYVADLRPKRYSPSDFSQTGEGVSHDQGYGDHEGKNIAIDPETGFALISRNYQRGCNDTFGGALIGMWDRTGERVDCTDQLTPPISIELTPRKAWTGMAATPDHRLYVTDHVAEQVHVFTIPTPQLPTIVNESVTDITQTSARVLGPVKGNLADTTVRVEYGTAPCSSIACATTPDFEEIGASFAAKPVSLYIVGLDVDTTYYYRLVATNSEGTEVGPDQSFRTYPEQNFDSSCGNNLARQQSGSAFLLDCRAYELVSAADTDGYDVISDLVPGETPFAAYPRAQGRALYAVKDGGIPGTGKPTNRGADPYVATRDAEARQWTTEYVGIPADAPSLSPFSSTLAGADAGLDNFAFGGPDICAPCFPDGSTGLPLRQGKNGPLQQGMAGSLPVAEPQPAGEVRKHFSEDGSHFVFGSEQQYESEGNPDNGNVTIYDRDLDGGLTQVVSTLPDGSTIENGDDVVALDVSDDGSRILIGNRVSTDPQGNDYFDLYMHVGSAAQSVEVADTADGVLYAGMTVDGSEVYFTTFDQLDDDTDASADLFRADVGPGSATVDRVSTGGGTGDTDSCNPSGNSFNEENWNVVPGGAADCSVVAAGGGGGIARESGVVYFLSPEKLDGSGVEGAPNLFAAKPGQPPELVATLESDANSPILQPDHPFLGSRDGYITPVSAAFDTQDGSTYFFDLRNANPFAEGTSASVQKFDAAGNVDLSFSGDGKIEGFGALSDGSFLGQPTGFPVGIAVDSSAGASAGTLYVPHLSFEGSSVKKFDPSGNPSGTIPVADIPFAVAVSPVNGNVYVVGFSGNVFVFDSSGAPTAPSVISGTPEGSRGVAVDSTGTVYVAGTGGTKAFDGATGASLGMFDAGAAFGVAVDLADDHVYIDKGKEVFEYKPNGSQVGNPIGGGGQLAKSVSLGAHEGHLFISNAGEGNFLEFGAADTPSDPAYDHPLVINSVRDSEERHTGDFQTTPSGEDAVFASTIPLSGVESFGQYQVFRYDANGDPLACLSCSPTFTTPTSHASLASNGLSITDDGRVFFTTGESLVLRDSNGLRDAYQWSDGKAELISTGQSAFDSSLQSVSADGTDAFFFTRERLVPEDKNGKLIKLYTARTNGGFFVIPPPPPCAASDECHGASSVPPAPAAIGTLQGSGGNQPPPRKKCRKGTVRKNGKCVKRKKRKGNSHKSRTRR